MLSKIPYRSLQSRTARVLFSTTMLLALFGIGTTVFAHNGIDHTKTTVPLTTVLKVGSRGAAVTALQEYLIHQGLLGEGNATGYFGPLTREAVRKLQRKHGLEDVGYTGPKTRALVNERSEAGTGLPEVVGTAFAADLRRGSRGQDVALLQKTLASLGYYDAPVTEKFDSRTKTALRAFQKQARLSASGSLNERTRELLNGMHAGTVDTADYEADSEDHDRTASTEEDEEEPTVSFRTNSKSVRTGGTVKLSWSAKNAISCTATDGWNGEVGLKGRHTFKPISTDTYTITCTNGSRTITESVTVRVKERGKSSGGGGGGSSKSSSNSSNQGSALQPSASVSAPESSGHGSHTETSTPAASPTLTLSGSTSSVSSGGSVTLTWSSTHAASCMASGGWHGAQATSGAKVLTNLTSTRTYTLTCSGAGGSVSKSTTVAVTVAQAPSPAPSGLTNVAFVESGLNIASLLGPKGIPPSSAPDVVGAFRFLCGPGQVSYDDPIVYPGQVGRAHLHQFFGNLGANAHSTYASLRTSGESTCQNMLNRSAYWMPAMLNGTGKVVRPDHVAIYYKRRPESDSFCTTAAKGCVGIPRGLRFVFGWDQTRPNEVQPENAAKFNFKCVENDHPVSGTYPDMVEVMKQCKPGQRLVAAIATPVCWDGVNLDSADHRSHLSDMRRDASTGYQSKCPASHPWIIPQFTMGVSYSIETGDNPTAWHLSSDHMMPESIRRAGASFHSDYFEAWEETIRLRWENGCINNMLNCSDGDLGDGQIMRRGPYYPPAKTNSRLIDVPVKPGSTAAIEIPRIYAALDVPHESVNAAAVAVAPTHEVDESGEKKTRSVFAEFVSRAISHVGSILSGLFL